MGIICKIKGHQWRDCICQRCGVKRNTNHIWNHCTCVRCGTIRDEDHVWEDTQGCFKRCTICKKGRYVHEWKDETKCLKVCRQCAERETIEDQHVWEYQRECFAICRQCQESLIQHILGEKIRDETEWHGDLALDYSIYRCERCGDEFSIMWGSQTVPLKHGDIYEWRRRGMMDPRER